MNSSKNKQRGVSLIGVLIVGGLLVFLGVIGAQVAPTYAEYRLIGKAVDKVKGSTTVADVRSNFDKAAQIDDIKAIAGKDLIVKQDDGKLSISFAYAKEIHLVGPAYLLMKYAGRSN